MTTYMLCNQWARWDGWFHSVELTGVVMLCKWVPRGRGTAAQCLTEMHVQCDIQLESSKLARSILWKRVKPLCHWLCSARFKQKCSDKQKACGAQNFLRLGVKVVLLQRTFMIQKLIGRLSRFFLGKCLCFSCFGGQALPTEVRLVYIPWSRQGLQHRKPPWRFLLPTRRV